MLSDRPYMRGDYERERTSVLTWLISAIIAGFIIQLLLGGPWLQNGGEMMRGLGLTAPGLRTGWVWTLLTHSFFHDTQFIFHILLNLFALYLLGRELLPMLGRKRFLGVYAAATVVGGLVWTAVHWRAGGDQMLLGSTAAVEALFVVFACFFPNQEMNFLLLFLFPVTLKPKHIAVILAAFNVTAFALWELPGASLPYGATLASSAHLGGMLTGFLFHRIFYGANLFHRRNNEPDAELPRWLTRAPKTPDATLETPPAPSLPTAEELRAEVDRILDKINSKGFGALTPEEKRILDDARDQLSRR